REEITIILNGIYLFFGLFYIFIFFKTKTDKAYLYFGCYAILLSTYLFHRTHFIYKLYYNSRWKDQVEYIVLFFLLPTFLLFLQKLFFQKRKIFLPSRIIIIYSSILALGVVMTPSLYHRTFLKLWQLSAIPSLFTCMGLVVYAYIQKKPLSRPIGVGFWGLFFVNIWDILDASWINTGIRISQYGFFVFIAALIFILINQMLNYQMEIEKQKNAFIKFVPFNFIELLDKKSILELRLGDQIQQEMTILFSDIRSFTALSEEMTPKENFDFINSYLNQSSPAIRNHRGFIDKYMGDGVMALFPKDSEDAVNAAIDKLQSVHSYNEERIGAGRKPIRIGIGIHTGMLMLGIVGEQERYDCTVISDAVNLTSRIESLTKVYSASILISEYTYEKLRDKSKYNIRIIDRVQVKGKNQPVKIYEIIDGMSKRVQKIKIATKEDFEIGIEAYNQKDFANSLAYFQKVLQMDPLDKAAELYITRIEYLQKHGVPLQWDGIERLEHK
ncbi:MAG: adenylate/guanylate cyclase domain-containing protein, partial [Spirochaetota bacterium]